MKSVFFRRLLVTLTICMLLASAIMVGGYAFLLEDAYADIELEEMVGKAELFRQLAAEQIAGNVEMETFQRLIVSFMEAAEAAITILDASGNIAFVSSTTQENLDIQILQASLQEPIQAVLAGESVSRNDVRLEGVGRLLVVGEPLGEAGGGVLLLKSVGSVALASRRLSVLLLWVVLAVVPIVLIGTVLQVKRETNPLHAMSEAAIAMSKGNFDIRLEEDGPGEVGVLSRALNKLCETLSGTIYQLRFEKGQLDQLLQSLTDGVAALDGSGALTHCNSALMRMFGAVNAEQREDITTDTKLWDTFDQVFDTGTPQTITYPMSGEKVLWITISPVVSEDGIRTGVVGLFKDMTEVERLEATRREYVANVSHELRTPLTAVRGLLEPLADGMVQDEETRQRYYKTMLHEVMRLSRLITDMMTLSRLQAGTEYVELMRVDMRELLSDVVSSYTAAAEKKGIHLTLDARAAVDGLTDPDRIEQVLVILLDNAMRHTPEGGKITLSVQPAVEGMLVSVTDTGSGIPEADLPHIFERFYKVDKSRGSGGTGLGLSIAQFIIDKLGEKITVESELGKGSRFTFSVKRYVSNAIALGPATENRRGVSQSETPSIQPTPPADARGAMDADYVVMDQGEKRRFKPEKKSGNKGPDSGRKRKE